MYHPKVRGTYYEMGSVYGSSLYRHGFRVQEQTAEKLEFGARSTPELRRVFPDVLDEIRGFADACHAPYEHMLSFILSIGAFKASPMCSTFATRSSSDVFFGRNYDFFWSFKKYTEAYLTRPENGYASIGHSDVFIGREDGINECGLAIAMTGVQDRVVKPGINFVLMVRDILDKCANTTEATRALSSTHFSSNSNFLVADKEGDMAVVEASPEKTRIRKPEKGFIVATNHFAHPEMQDMERLEARSMEEWDSLPRYTTIHRKLQERKGKIDLKYAQEILSDHSGFVCSHQKKIKLGTLWSIAASLRESRIFRAEGNPCRTAFRQDTRLLRAMDVKKEKKL